MKVDKRKHHQTTEHLSFAYLARLNKTLRLLDSRRFSFNLLVTGRHTFRADGGSRGTTVQKSPFKVITDRQSVITSINYSKLSSIDLEQKKKTIYNNYFAFQRKFTHSMQTLFKYRHFFLSSFLSFFLFNTHTHTHTHTLSLSLSLSLLSRLNDLSLVSESLIFFCCSLFCLFARAKVTLSMHIAMSNLGIIRWFLVGWLLCLMAYQPSWGISCQIFFCIYDSNNLDNFHWLHIH